MELLGLVAIFHVKNLFINSATTDQIRDFRFLYILVPDLFIAKEDIWIQTSRTRIYCKNWQKK